MKIEKKDAYENKSHIQKNYIKLFRDFKVGVIPP
jgi:hypothetical protein